MLRALILAICLCSQAAATEHFFFMRTWWDFHTVPGQPNNVIVDRSKLEQYFTGLPDTTGRSLGSGVNQVPLTLLGGQLQANPANEQEYVFAGDTLPIERSAAAGWLNIYTAIADDFFKKKGVLWSDDLLQLITIPSNIITWDENAVSVQGNEVTFKHQGICIFTANNIGMALRVQELDANGQYLATHFVKSWTLKGKTTASWDQRTQFQKHAQTTHLRVEVWIGPGLGTWPIMISQKEPLP
jgi:hypothetical protein